MPRQKNERNGGFGNAPMDRFKSPPGGDAMNHYSLNLISPNLKRTARRVVRWTTIDIVLGAVCGAIFGGVFGGFGLLIHFAPSQIVSIAGYFALCGGAAGALVGVYGGIFDDAGAPETVCASPRSTEPSARRVEPVRESGMPGQRQPQNRLAPDSTTVRQRREVGASQKHSWN
jgi:hypothetical protein